jgi:hypothetical protein
VNVSDGWSGDSYVNHLLSAMQDFEKMDSPVKPWNDADVKAYSPHRNREKDIRSPKQPRVGFTVQNAAS